MRIKYIHIIVSQKQAKKREEWLLNNSEKGHRLGNKSTGAAQTSLKAGIVISICSLLIIKFYFITYNLNYI